MARLVYWDKAGKEHTVQIGRDYPDITVGRHPECDIRTSNGSVSRRHCTIRFTPGGIELADQNSSSGTYVNQRRVSRQFLLDGDEINCGSFVLRYHNDEGPQTLEQDKIVIVHGRLNFQDDNGKERSLILDENQNRILVGRATDALIRSTDGSVSRRHSEFTCVSSTFEVADLGSSNGTFVNGQKITRQVLRHGDEVNCGRLTIKFLQEEEIVAPSPQAAMIPEPQPVQPSGMVPNYYDPGPQLGSAQETVLPIQGRSAPAAPIPPSSQSAPLSPVYPGGSTLADPDIESPSAPAIPYQPQVRAADSAVDTLAQENAALRQELENLKLDTEARARDLEKEVKQKQMVIDSFQDKYDRLKIQSDEQLQQLDTYRDEIRQKREVIEDQQYKLSLIEEAHDRGNNQVAVLIEENANLKVSVNQLERQLTEADRLANLNEFELKKIEGELEGLRDMVSDEGSENADLQNELVRLRQVIDAKESALIESERQLEQTRSELRAYTSDAGGNDVERERLLGEIDIKVRRIESLKLENEELVEALERAKSAPADDGSALEVKIANRRLMRELDDLKAELDEALSGGRGAGSQLNELKRANRDQRYKIEELETQVDALRANGGGGDPHEADRHRSERDAMERRIQELERSLDAAQQSQGRGGDNLAEIDRLRGTIQRLERDLDDLRAKSRTPADSGVIVANASEMHTLLNDIVSQLKNDMQLIQDYITDVRKLYETYRRVDTQILPTLDRVRIEKIIKEVDPDVTFEELAHILGECVSNSEDMKSALIDFKGKVLN